MIRKVLVPFIVFVVLWLTNAFCALARSSSVWGALDRLIGTWIADSASGGRPGTATSGGETWQLELDGCVLVRRDVSEYPATANRPAFRHAGLTVIWPRPEGGFKASAYDNEGHNIEYDVVASDTAIVFTSHSAPSAPKFRLTYRPVSTGYAIRFEIATPSQPEVFHPYVTGGIHRTP